MQKNLVKILILCVLIALFLTDNIFPQVPQDKYKQKGIELFNQGRLEDAIKEFQKFLEKNPENAEVLCLMGVVFRQYGTNQLSKAVNTRNGSRQLMNALNGLMHASKIDTNNYKIHYELAQTYDEMDKYHIFLPNNEKTTYALAIETYEKAIQLKPGYKEAYYSLGSIYHRKGKYELAAKNFEDVIKYDADNFSAYLQLADCYAKQGKNKLAIETLNEASRLEPQNANPFLLKGNIFWYQCEYLNAKIEYEKVLNLDSKNKLAHARLDSIARIQNNNEIINTYIQQGDRFSQNRSYDKAIEQYKLVLTLAPNHQTVKERISGLKTRLYNEYYQQGSDDAKVKKLESAVRKFNKALEYAQDTKQMNKIIRKWQDVQQLMGADAKMYQVLKKGKSFIIAGKFSEAISYYDVLYREGVGNPDKIKSKLDSLKVIECYQNALNKEDSAMVNGNIEDLMAALVYYREVFKFDSTYRDVVYRIEKLNGELAYAREEWTKAIVQFEKILQINPKDYTILKKIKRAKTAKYFPFILAIVVSLAAILSFFGYKHREKIFSYFSLKNKTRILLFITFFLIFVAYISIHYTVKVGILNLEQSFQVIGTILLLALFLIFASIQKETNVNFDITSKFVEFSLNNIEENGKSIRIIKDTLESDALFLENFKQLTFTVQKFTNIIDNSDIFQHCQVTVRPIDEEIENYSVNLKKTLNSSLQIKAIDIPQNHRMSFKKDNSSFEVGLIPEDDNGDKNHSLIDIDSLSPIDMDVKNCIVLVKDKIGDTTGKIIDRTDGIYSIELDENEKIDIVGYGEINKRLGIQIHTGNFVTDDNPVEICHPLSIDSLSLIENIDKASPVSAVEYGTISIGNEKRVMSKKETLKVHPTKFSDFIVQLTSNQMTLFFASKLSSLKIGRYRGLDEQQEEIQNIAKWISKKKFFYVVIGFLAWMSFLSAIEESHFFQNIKDLIGL